MSFHKFYSTHSDYPQLHSDDSIPYSEIRKSYPFSNHNPFQETKDSHLEEAVSVEILGYHPIVLLLVVKPVTWWEDISEQVVRVQ